MNQYWLELRKWVDVHLQHDPPPKDMGQKLDRFARAWAKDLDALGECRRELAGFAQLFGEPHSGKQPADPAKLARKAAGYRDATRMAERERARRYGPDVTPAQWLRATDEEDES
jgi:hypothetical protein